MAYAVKEWDNARPDLNNKPISMKTYAASKGMPYATFHAYARTDKENCNPLGAHVGRRALLNDRQSEVVCQAAIRAGRANMCLTPMQLQEKIGQVEPSLSEKQIINHRQTFSKKHKKRLKPKSVMAQKTTSRRSQHTLARQFRWFKAHKKALDFLRKHNTGTCPKTGKTFGELIEHFVLGGDETNLMADNDGNMKIVGELGRRKHEERVSDCKALMIRLLLRMTSVNIG